MHNSHIWERPAVAQLQPQNLDPVYKSFGYAQSPPANPAIMWAENPPPLHFPTITFEFKLVFNEILMWPSYHQQENDILSGGINALKPNDMRHFGEYSNSGHRGFPSLNGAMIGNTCAGCYGSNKVLTGHVGMDDIAITYDALQSKYGVEFIIDRVAAVDPETRSISLQSGDQLSYDRLNVSPGIDFI